MSQAHTILGYYTLSGFRIPLVETEAARDFRFMSQRQLQDMGTVGAYAELRRRAQIVASRVAA